MIDSNNIPKLFLLSFSLVFSWTLVCCGPPETKKTPPLNGNDVPLKESEKMDGELEIYDSVGQIVEKRHYKNGIPEGDQWRWDHESNSLQHSIYLNGKSVYRSDHVKGNRVDNQLLPVITEQFFFEDKYYAKLQFPVFYAGEIKMHVLNVSEYQLMPNEYGQYQLVINDALDLNAFVLEMEYCPADTDSLIYSRHFFKQVIYENN